MSNELPKGWASAALSDIANIGPRHPKGLDDDMLVTFVSMAAIDESKPDFQFTEERPLREVRKGFTHFAERDILFAKITPCMENGKGAVARGLRNKLGCGTTELHVVRPLAGISSDYIYRFLAQSSVRRAAKENFTGTAGQARVPTSFMEGLEIPLAPLNEQQRIAAKLEKLLGQVDTCQTRLARIPALLKRFRQSVLAAACSGRLTADWREKNQPGESGQELLRRIVRDRRRWWEESQLIAFRKAGKSPKDDCWKAKYVEPATANIDELEILPDGWTWGTWDQVSNWVTYGFTRPMPHVKNGIPIVTARHVLGRKIELTETDSTTRTAFDDLSAKDRPMTGDLLITKDGSMGRAALVETEVPFCINQSVAVVWLRSLTLDRKFLLTAVEWPYTQNCIGEKARGAAIQHLSITDFAKLSLPIPSLPEQQEIVRRVENLFVLADRIEARFAEGQKRVSSITQAILAKAFRGELVPTEYELAKAEGRSFESAEELLDRIKQSGQIKEGEKKPRRLRSSTSMHSTV